jgi:hypothetical protein
MLMSESTLPGALCCASAIGVSSKIDDEKDSFRNFWQKGYRIIRGIKGCCRRDTPAAD